jgi:hypothetical protein
MTEPRTPSQQIIEEVTSWPGVEAGPGDRGEFAFKLGRRQIGHLHGDHTTAWWRATACPPRPKYLDVSCRYESRD